MEGHAEAGLSQLCEGRALTEPRRRLATGPWSHQQPGTGAGLGPGAAGPSKRVGGI